MLLQRMVDCLVSRSLADCVFVSTSLFVSDLLSERDKNHSKVTHLSDVQGNTLGNEKKKVVAMVLIKFVLEFLNYMSKV
jgi:hypothetical protein